MKALLLLLTLLSVTGAVAQETDRADVQVNSAAGAPFVISWHKIAAGGTVIAQGGPYTLGSTIGQHDDTASELLQGGSWSLTGGFWAAGFGPASGDWIFRDRFEDQ